MGIKTTINEKGVISEVVSGDSNLAFDIRVTQAAKNNQSYFTTNVSTTSSVLNKFTVISPTSSLGITASLPAISTANLGTEVCLMVGTGSSDPVLVSASNGIRPGSAWTTVFSGAHATLGLQSVSSSVGYYWHVMFKNNNL